MKKANNFPIVKASGCCLAFSFFNFNFAMLKNKGVVHKKKYEAFHSLTWLVLLTVSLKEWMKNVNLT